MNRYLKKRVQNHIKRSDMANMLGVSYSFYYAIERGDVKMPLNLIDKFNEIISKGKENEIKSAENKIKADEFWEQMHKKDETGRWELVNKMHEFNINNYDELVALLGYKSVGTVYNYLQDRNPVGDEFKKRLYNFFSDETNIQIPKADVKRNKTYKIGNTPRKSNAKLDRYYEKTDFKKILQENHITNVQIADAIGVHNSTVSQMTCKKYKPSYKTIQSVKDYLDSVINVENKNVSVNSDFISRQRLIDECNQEIEKNRTEIEVLQSKIKELEAKNEISIKVIEFIKNI